MTMMLTALNVSLPPDGNTLMIVSTTPPTFPNGTINPGNDVRTLFDTLIHVDIHCSSNDLMDYPIKPFIHDSLQVLKAVNNKNTILPINPNSSLGSITMESDILSGDMLSTYIDGISIPSN